MLLMRDGNGKNGCLLSQLSDLMPLNQKRHVCQMSFPDVVNPCNFSTHASPLSFLASEPSAAPLDFLAYEPAASPLSFLEMEPSSHSITWPIDGTQTYKNYCWGDQ
eukprot:g80882.t1